MNNKDFAKFKRDLQSMFDDSGVSKYRGREAVLVIKDQINAVQRQFEAFIYSVKERGK